MPIKQPPLPRKTFFTLSEARALLPEVRRITEYYYRKVEELRAIEMDEGIPNRLTQLAESLIEQWVKEVQSLNVQCKGMWTCDFDSGDGFYYCWRYPEPDILFFHLYETGFAGRRPIELLE